MSKLIELLEEAKSVAIIGHIRPDGDDIGSCLGTYNYILENYPQIEKVKVFLEDGPRKFNFLKNFDKTCKKPAADDKDFDLVICQDAASFERLGDNGVLLHSAKHSLCLDHHKTNPGYCEFNDVRANASSTSEVLYEHLDPDKISAAVAECIYTGIAHDTGIFQYSCTSQRTMEIGGELLKKGISQDTIITESYYQKSIGQLRAWGYAYSNAILTEGGKIIYSIFTWKDMKHFGIGSIELDGISSELRNVEGVEFAMLIYQDGEKSYKVSMRSGRGVDCSKVAVLHGGGGHAQASGCNCDGAPEDIAATLINEVREQL